MKFVTSNGYKLCSKFSHVIFSDQLIMYIICNFFSFGATAPIWALVYLHETLRFT
jgi:hypothetical protein